MPSCSSQPGNANRAPLPPLRCGIIRRVWCSIAERTLAGTGMSPSKHTRSGSPPPMFCCCSADSEGTLTSTRTRWVWKNAASSPHSKQTYSLPNPPPGVSCSHARADTDGTGRARLWPSCGKGPNCGKEEKKLTDRDTADGARLWPSCAMKELTQHPWPGVRCADQVPQRGEERARGQHQPDARGAR